MTALLDIFTYPFFQKALVGGILIGLMSPLVGAFLVYRRLSMIGDTLSHVSIAGVALGFLVGLSPQGIGVIFAVIAAFAIEQLRTMYRAYAELSIAIMMSGGVALASIFITMGKGTMNVTGYLFGSIYTLDMADLLLVGGVTLIVLLFVGLNFKELFLLTFDEDAARVNGLPHRAYNLLITLLTALTISAAIKLVGALLVSALITVPVASSMIIARNFRHSVWLSVLYSEIAVIVGIVAASLWSWAPSGTIVLLLIVMLIGTIAVKKGLTR
jgi:zinc transport system permease protein